jgi:hypothetical protein
MVNDQEVRQQVYLKTVETGRPPRASEVAAVLGCGRDEMLAAFRELRARKLLALAPESGEIVMAPPFSAVPTPFHVIAGDRDYFANCVWDAYGVAAALHRDARVEASCGCCGEAMKLAVRDGRPVATAGVAHFAVPAASWWDDITYT